MRIEKYTYDETMKRTRAIEEVIQGKEKQFLDVIRLYEFVSQVIVLKHWYIHVNHNREVTTFNFLNFCRLSGYRRH